MGTGMHIDMCIHMCIDLCIDMHIAVCIDMCIDDYINCKSNVQQVGGTSLRAKELLVAARARAPDKDL